jgi:hypothetical protein
MTIARQLRGARRTQSQPHGANGIALAGLCVSWCAWPTPKHSSTSPRLKGGAFLFLFRNLGYLVRLKK